MEVRSVAYQNAVVKSDARGLEVMPRERKRNVLRFAPSSCVLRARSAEPDYLDYDIKGRPRARGAPFKQTRDRSRVTTCVVPGPRLLARMERARARVLFKSEKERSVDCEKTL